MWIDPLTHRLDVARYCPSPNADARPEGTVIDLIVVHSISLPPGEFGGAWIDDLFTNQLDTTAHPYFETLVGLRVSAHLLILRKGDCVQYVPFDQRAWHAGMSEYDGRSRCNDFSIGIELEGTDTLPYTEAQYLTLAQVIKTLWAAYPTIPKHRLTGHADIAPGRKKDPGPIFDWAKLSRSLDGLSVV